MFREIVSNLPFSPALVGQLSFYAKRLRDEEATRKLGLVFVVLTLIVQSMTVFQPAEPANASSSTDMVNGGISSMSEYLAAYDSNTKHLKDTMNFIGITRDEIARADYGTFVTGERISWGFAPRFSYADGERQHSVTDSRGRLVTTVYSRPLKLWTSSKTVVHAWMGRSKKLGWFAIMRSCGNLVTEVLPPPPPKPCPGNPSLAINDKSCIPNLFRTKTATNTSQGFVNASNVVANAGDQISYTLTMTNTGLQSITANIEENLEDVMQYSTLIDNGGGSFNETTKILTWPKATLKPKSKQTRTFVVKVLNPIPATAKGVSDPTSFDCVMTNTFGNTINIQVDCPVPKTVETVAAVMPQTGPTENMIFSGVVLGVAVYFYARSRQQKKEVYVIRRDVTTGAI